MCGFLGIASVDTISDRGWLEEGSSVIKHRGPDDSGVWWSDDGRIGLAHRRLAIIDVSEAGYQPMHDKEKRFTVLFNGEIYNHLELKKDFIKEGHHFFSTSDTEVLLVAYQKWGADCLEHLNGMFSFAIYDAVEEKVFLARDRAGEKPLFYYHQNNQLRFASELKSLLSDQTLEKELDLQSLDLYLSMGYIPADQCILKSFSKLPPAQALLYDLNSDQLKKWQYWKLPEMESNGREVNSESELIDSLEKLLKDSVEKQLIADVPLGVLLSGGVDSSLITAFASQFDSNLKTFTIRFPGQGKYDESEHARKISDYYGTEHIEMDASIPDASLLIELATQFDEPISDSSILPTYLVSRLVRQHCTVALGGDGGDELFGGYETYNRYLNLRSSANSTPHGLRKMVSGLAENMLPVGLKGRNYIQDWGTDFKTGLPVKNKIFDRKTRKELSDELYNCTEITDRFIENRIPKNEDLIQRATRFDFNNYLPEDVLVKVDRCSMLNSLEVRAPFLDYRIIEFAFGKIQSHYKVNSGERKIILKNLARKFLPPDFDFQRKQGFSIPISEWLKAGEFRDLFYDLLLDSNAYFKRSAVEKLLLGQDKGRSNSDRLFTLFMFEVWRKEYLI